MLWASVTTISLLQWALGAAGHPGSRGQTTSSLSLGFGRLLKLGSLHKVVLTSGLRGPEVTAAPWALLQRHERQTDRLPGTQRQEEKAEASKTAEKEGCLRKSLGENDTGNRMGKA